MGSWVREEKGEEGEGAKEKIANPIATPEENEGIQGVGVEDTNRIAKPTPTKMFFNKKIAREEEVDEEEEEEGEGGEYDKGV